MLTYISMVVIEIFNAGGFEAINALSCVYFYGSALISHVEFGAYIRSMHVANSRLQLLEDLKNSISPI